MISFEIVDVETDSRVDDLSIRVPQLGDFFTIQNHVSVIFDLIPYFIFTMRHQLRIIVIFPTVNQVLKFCMYYLDSHYANLSK